MSTGGPTAFGALLRRYRAAAQVTQKQLAERVGMTSSAIAALERGARRPPPAATVALLADALDLSHAERAAFQAAVHSIELTAGANSPIHAPDARRPNQTQRRHVPWMPLQPTPLIGRTQEVEAIHQALTVDGVRLLSLVGPAGVGKTRLALAAAAEDRLADHYFDGVIVVDLTPIRAHQDVLGTIARACGVTDTSPFPLGERLVASLQERATLLVLDNFEQVLPAAASLAELLAHCPDLTLLVTSRAPLHVRWEQTLLVAPLAVPDLSRTLPPRAELATIPSVTLFLQRARARRASFALTDKQTPLVAQLVAQLDGLPLAIELAAARLDVLSLSALTRRLADRMQLLAVDAPDLPERQQSLEAAVGWSYDLLSAREQRLFRCLGVFVGRVTLDAIAAVDSVVGAVGGEADDGMVGDEREVGNALRPLLSLAEKSLLLPIRSEESSGQGGFATEPEQEAEEEPEPAFDILETVREYAWERLAAAGELTVARRAHAHYFLALAERAEQKLRGLDQRAWFLRLEREQDNVRAALRWLFDQDDEAERVATLRLVGALGWFWAMFGYHVEGVRWLEEALARAPQNQGPRTRALISLGMILASRGETGRVRTALLEALALAEGRDPNAAAMARIPLGHAVHMAGEQEEGNRLMQEALRHWEALGDSWGIGLALCSLGLAADMAGDTVAAVAHYTAGLRELEAAGDVHQAAYYHGFLGVNAWKLGDLRSGVSHVRAGLRAGVAFRDRWLLSMAAQATLALGWAHALPEPRARLLGAADALAQTTGAAFPVEPGGQEVMALRERLAQEGKREDWGLAAAYREGRALSFDAVATLALRLLEEAAESLPSTERPGRARQTDEHAGERAAPHASQNPLTVREIAVLRLVAQGLSSKLIARQLSIAPGTVNYHLATIFNKLGVDTRAQAVAVATQRGLL
jgi:predicted ATPase/DNA-binding CsgD family transcriptional regulator/transcriptional regulator with XRE-family HTH domain